MGRNSKSLGNKPTDYVNQLDREAEAIGLSRSKYIQQRLDAGRHLFDTGKVDVQLLNNLMETDGSERVNSDIQSIDDDISQAILNVLPADENRSATKEELRKEIFGTKEDQLEAITETLKSLNKQDKVRPAFEGGYVQTDD